MAYRRRSRKTRNSHRRALKKKNVIAIRARKANRKKADVLKFVINGEAVRH